MFKNRKQQHVGIFTSDLDEQIKFYTEVFGYKLHQRGFVESMGIHFAFVGSEDKETMFELLYIPEAADDFKHGMIDHFCYDTDDVEADYAYCVEQGFEVLDGGIVHLPEMWDNGVKFVKFKTTTNQIIEFAQIL